MVPHRSAVWHLLAAGLGATAPSVPPGSAPASVRYTNGHQPLDCGDDPNSAGSGKTVDTPIDTLDSPDLTRLERAYKTARSIHRSYLSATDRSAILGMMQTFRQSPNRTEVFKHIDWRAERDALIDRALALGYVIGELRAVRSGTRSWSAIGFGTICGAPFVYPIGGDYSQAPAPRNGSATLMNRRWAMLGADDLEPRPYIAAIPRWFLLEPTQG